MWLSFKREREGGTMHMKKEKCHEKKEGEVL
jgi:hypothetical protein